mgnify:CR=1 FL=1
MPFTNVAKPTGASYTNLAKPALGGGTILRAGMTQGLLIPLTWPTTRILGGGYTRRAKPTGTPYTNIAKPT